MAPVNVVVSGLPHCGVLCLKLADVSLGVTAAHVETAISHATGMPPCAVFLRTGTRLLLWPSDVVSPPGVDTAFVSAALRRALPGGKGGFGAQLRRAGASSKASTTTSTNIDACRDLNGRRIGTVRRENEAQLQLRMQHQQQQQQQQQQQLRKRGRTSPVPDTNNTSTQTPSSTMDNHHAVIMTDAIAERGQQAADLVAAAVRDGLMRGAKRTTPDMPLDRHDNRLNQFGHDGHQPHDISPVSTSASTPTRSVHTHTTHNENHVNLNNNDRMAKRRRTTTPNVLTMLEAYPSSSSSEDEAG